MRRKERTDSTGGVGYCELEVWQKAMDFVTECYRAVTEFPASEEQILRPLLLRAVVCLPAGIAEGYARQNSSEFAQFLSIASGSLSEVETYLMLAARLGYLAPHKSESLLHQASEIHKLLVSQRKSLLTRNSFTPAPDRSTGTPVK